MKYKTSLFIITVALILLNTACFDPHSDPTEFDAEGYKPVYATQEDLEKIEVLSPKAMEEPGKIYVYDQFLFVNERFEGIHIINNANPSSPEKIAFIQLPGNIDMAVKGQSSLCR